MLSFFDIFVKIQNSDFYNKPNADDQPLIGVGVHEQQCLCI